MDDPMIAVLKSARTTMLAALQQVDAALGMYTAAVSQPRAEEEPPPARGCGHPTSALLDAATFTSPNRKVCSVCAAAIDEAA